MAHSDTEDEDLLTDLDELLFRHVHPNWVRDGVPTSQTFKPTPKDAGKLSVVRGSLTTAAEAFALYTGQMNLRAKETWAITVEEVGSEPLLLQAYAEPVLEPVPDPAHAYIDFRALSRRQSETKAKLLLAAALRRGRQHP